MSKLAMVIGFAYVGLGVSVAVSPEWLLSVVDWESRQRLYIAAAIRLGVGLVLILSAPASKYPMVFRVIGAIALIAGLVLPFVPLDVWAEFMRWWTVENPALFRAISATAAILGGAFIAYAASSRRWSY